MARKKGNTKRGSSNPTSGPQNSITLRQEATGKIKPKVSNNAKVYLNHLENLATWASGQPSLPSLAAFFGQRLAAAAESLAVAPDPSLFLCARCETVLQPGSNCYIRIEKNNAKKRRRHKKASNVTQNVVAYYCHYCSCRNIKRGTPKGHMKVLYGTECVSKVKSVVVKDGKECENKILTVDAPTTPPLTTVDCLTIDTPAIPSLSTTRDDVAVDTTAVPPTEDISVDDGPAISSPRTTPAIPSTSSVTSMSRSQVRDIPTLDAPATPLTLTAMTLLDSKRRKRKKPSSKNRTEPESCSAPTSHGEKSEDTSKRKRNRKSWTSLKEIAQREEEKGKQNVAGLAIPFSL
ncbi:Rpr2 domain-containing protein [Cucumis melo var. makuwa]|uniref:Rpr2 domain-containing protein n=2 Tax=Cucumis melo TaxID=3656 RepID=A0A5D3CYJ3_CUCMM|nr:Rpr2 domain-containing protein [Cucumis melo var. makuwa]